MKFHYLARAVICSNEKILLVSEKGAKNTFLPGGHIEMGEAAEKALEREINEELGLKATIGDFIGACEHVWPDDTKSNHEINLVFKSFIEELDDNITPVSKENHIEFLWAFPDELDELNFLPPIFKTNLQKYLRDSNTFWGSSIVDD